MSKIKRPWLLMWLLAFVSVLAAGGQAIVIATSTTVIAGGGIYIGGILILAATLPLRVIGDPPPLFPHQSAVGVLIEMREKRKEYVEPSRGHKIVICGLLALTVLVNIGIPIWKGVAS